MTTEPRPSANLSRRRAVAVESFKTASECIGPITPGMAIFAITRGQFSMIDAALHVLEQVGPARLSLWTWTIAEYEIMAFDQLRKDGRITTARLIIDPGGKKKNASLIEEWRRQFGRKTVAFVKNHAKIVSVESASGLRVLVRGSMNLNFNPRFEQLDVTEGGPDFDLVRKIEEELAELCDLPETATVAQEHAEARRVSRLADAYDSQTLDLFEGVKVWAK
jgi:hypothetical protein